MAGEPEVLRRNAERIGRPDLVPVHEAERAVNPVPRRLASGAAASADLGFLPTVPFDAGIRDLVAWWRSETAPSALEARS